jgi:hypothetical protein
MDVKKHIHLFIIILLLVSCERNWDNPSDEGNTLNLDWSPYISFIKQEDIDITLAFGCYQDNVNSYIIERSVDNSSFSKVADLPETEFNYTDVIINGMRKTVIVWTDTDVTQGGKIHKYRIFAKVGNKLSNYVEGEIDAYVAPEFSVSIESITQNSFSYKINVTDNGGAPLVPWYNIYVREEGKQEDPNNFGTIWDNGETIKEGTVNYLKASTVYYAKFEMINNQYKKGLSESVKITTK